MKHLLLLLILSLFSFSPIWAVGEWEVFSSNGQYRQLAEFRGKLYTLSGSSIFWTDPATGDKGTLTTADGMHGSDVAFVLNSKRYLVIVYRNGLVDLMTDDGTFIDIPDFQNKIITGSRTIHQAKVCGRELFLACDFGVVQVDLSTLNIRYSYPTPSPCINAFSFGDYLYYSTEQQGVMRCHRKANYLIRSQWEQVFEKTLYDAAVFTDHEGRMRCWVTPKDSDLVEIDSLGIRKHLSKWNNRKLYPSGPYVFCSGWGMQAIRIKDRLQAEFHSGPFGSCCGYFAPSDTLFYALHPTLGLQQYSLDIHNNGESTYQLVDADLSYDLNYQEWLGSKCADLEIDAEGALVTINGDKMWSGGYNGMFVSHSIINTLADGEWDYITEDYVIDQLRQSASDPSSIPSDYYRGLTDLVCHPSESRHLYVGTLTHGMYEFLDGELIAHYDAQSTPQGPVSMTENPATTRLTALAFDADENLWTGYSFANCALAAMSPSGQWVRHPLRQGNSLSNVGRILPARHSSTPLIWLAQNFGYQKCSISILYNPGGAMDASQDKSVTFSTLVDQDGNAIAPSQIYDLCEDHDGIIWILTSNGPFRVDNPVATFNFAEANTGRGLVYRVKVPRNDGTNLADYLMANTPCTCMAIDNYNRKWIGTNGNGLYLLSADCLTLIEHFTADNSLLPSDDIIALTHDPASSKLYVSTGSGLTAYHADDLAGEDNFNSMYCYPNPVRPDFTGELRIMGLMEDSTVAITDASGNLLYRTNSLGSTAVWDIRANDGKRVAPGVYLIHGTSADTSQGKIIKVLVL